MFASHISKSRHSHPSRKAGRRRFVPFLESLEDRVLLAVEPITLVDPSRAGLSALGVSQDASVSDDGQIVAFQSDAPDLVASDLNDTTDVFVYFRSTGRVELVSINKDGTGSANAAARNPRVSPDGRYVLFESSASNLVPEVGLIGGAQLYARDLQNGQTILISKNTAGTPGNAGSGNGWWSGDSTRVVFESTSSNLSPIDTNSQQDVFLRDLAANTTTLLSVNRDGTAGGDRRSFSPQISRDGKFVAFTSFASDLVPTEQNNHPDFQDLFVRDLTTGTTEIIDVDVTGLNQPNSNSSLTENAISPDGRYVLFVTSGSNVASVPVGNGNNLYLRDRDLDTTTLVSINAADTAGVGGFSGSITPDARFVTFVSSGTGLDAAINDTNTTFDVFRRDLTTGVTKLVTVNTAGSNGGDAQSFSPVVSADGRSIAFVSEAGNLSADPDGNQGQTTAANRRDVFVRDMQTGLTTNASSGGNGLSQLFVASADLKTIAFETLADNLVPGDRNARQDVVVRDRNLGVSTLASRREPSFPTELLGGGGLNSATPDGRYVAFTAGPSQDYAPDVTFDSQTSSVYVRDRQTGAITVVDLTPNPTVAGGGFSPIITPNGRFVSFVSTVPSARGTPPLVDGITFLGNFLFGTDVYVRDLEAGVTTIVSVDPTGTQSNNGNNTFEHAISDDGRYVAFTSNSDNLVNGLANPDDQVAVYQRDLWTGQTVLVSHNLANDGAITGASSNLSMTSDGRFITFTSRATDLTANDTNNQPDVFQWDRQSGAVTLVSSKSDGSGPGDNDSGGAAGFRPVMSADGRFVAFGSRASDLVAGDTNGLDDVFVRDMQAVQPTLVSVSTAGINGANRRSLYPAITPDGRTVAFLSAANNLTTAPVPVVADQVYVRDLNANETRLVSFNAAGTAASNNASVVSSSAIDSPTISPDGRYVVFRSRATDLIDGFVDTNGIDANVYLRDLSTDTTRLVTYNQSGTAGAGDDDRGFRFLFAGDNGTTEVLFDTLATDVFPGDRNDGADSFAFAIVGLGQIQGTVIADADRNGTQNGSEAGLSGIGVYLDTNGNGRRDVGEAQLITDATGRFAFTNLAAGTYKVGVLLPGGFEATTPEYLPVTLPNDTAIVLDRNFGAAPAVADLAVTNVSAPSALEAGQPFTVNWITANQAGQAIAGDWQEAVYLSADNVLDGSDRLLGTLAHTGGLGAFSSVGRTLTVAAPATLTGQFFVFVQADRRNQVPADTNRTNNLAFAFDPLTITIPELTVAAPAAGVFGGVNQERLFRITVEPGQTVQLTLDSTAEAGGTELYAAFARVPSPYDFDHAARVVNQPDQILTIPLTRPGTYYVLARSRSGAAATAPFTLAAANRSFDITAISPNSGPPTGRVTVEIRGTGFGLSTVPTLVQGGTVIGAAMVEFHDPSLLYATFDLTGRPMGAYDVHLVDGAVTDTLSAAFTVREPVLHNQLLSSITLINPDAVRAGRQGRVLVEYFNPSDTDIVAPLLRLTATNALLRLPGAVSFETSDLTFYAHAPDGPAGILRPGQRSQVEIEFLSTGAIGDPIDFQTFFINPNEIMDWAAIKADFRPGHIPVDAWDAVFANFLAEAGTTVGDYQAMLSRLANYLSSVGIYTPDTMRLLNLALDMADGANSAGSLASVLDSSQPASGFDLTFSRHYQQPIHGRYTVGPFGRGWAHNWDGNATTLPEGDVVVRFGSSRRFFFLLPDGGYRGTPGDTGTLTLAGGMYTLTELDGSVTRFRTDGKFDFVTDPNGNRITAGYDGSGRLNSLTHASGPSIALTYNAQGFIDRLTDSAGRVVNYTYTGDHLTGYTDQYGSHTYTYVTGQGLAREHALASVNFSDDTHVTFAYDTRGRLVGEERDGSTQRLTYTYLSGSAYTITDATGGTQTPFFDDHGQLVRTVDALGRVVDLTYDAEFNLTQVEQAGGTVSQFSYDAFGNLTTAIDPMGQRTEFSYDSHANLTSFTDALGRTTSYRYDAANNLLGIDYPNGTDEQFTYDASGDTASVTNRRGTVIGHETNAAGQITKKTYADGSTVTYTYDGRGRLKTATDSTGTIDLEYDDRDVLTKVTYPNGRFLRFEYNIVGQRTRSVDQDGFTVKYVYDDPGRLDRLTDGTDALIVDYTYDAASRLIREDKGNGTATTYTYDLAGEVLTITHLAPGGAVNSRYEYTYDALGRRTTMTLTDSDTNTPDGTTTYGYDALGQLISVALPGGRTILYQYDAVGNRVSVNDNGVITSYTTNVANEYTQVGDTTYTYDLDGNLHSKTDPSGTTVYSFDDENRLVGVNGPGLGATYTYDALNHRNSATVNGVTTSYLIDPVGLWSVTGEYDGTGVALARYTYGNGLVSRVDSSGAAYYDFDTNANIIGLTDTSGQYVNRYQYLPFGEVTTIRATFPNRFTFGGEFGIMNDSSGMFDMRARDYDPATGRFASNDPLGLTAEDANFRRYVGNDPVGRIDPLGLCDPRPDWFKWLWRFAKWVSGNGDPDNADTGIGGGSGGNGDGSGVAGGNGGDIFDPDGSWGDNAGGDDCNCDCPPGRDPKGPSRPGPGGRTGTARSFDPNDITGPAGFGTAHFVTAEQTMPYTIRFENVSTATAAAQDVVVTHQLDADLNPLTFALGDIGFGALVIDVPDGMQTYSTRIAYQNLDGSPLAVDFSVVLDLDTRIVSWTFRSVDPATGLPPNGVLEGFLPPNDASGRGEGFVTYTIRPKGGLVTGTTTDQQASIVFDTNDTILTNTFTNTLDTAAPASSVEALPAVTTSETFTVRWSGSDDANGSGITNFDVFVSDNGGPFMPWQAATSQTSAPFTGTFGHTYAFYSVASDGVGHRQTLPTSGQATTRLSPPLPATATVAAVAQPAVVAPVGATLKKAGKRKKMVVQLAFSDGSRREIVSPYQSPRCRSIRAVLIDSDGNGTLDSLVLTARKGNKLVRRIVRL